MLFVLSPAKTIDESPIDTLESSTPTLLKESKKLVKLLKKMKSTDLMKLMNVSEKLADLNVSRFKKFKTPFDVQNSKPALFAFKGDVYLGLEADDLNKNDIAFAQKNLRILSGLYGVLKPLDLIQSYRLEMGTRLSNGHGKNLYEFWGDKIVKEFNKELNIEDSPYIINLASIEYFKAIKSPKLKAEVINIHFKEHRNGTLKVISFNAKKARGAMAKQIIQKRIESPDKLKKLNVLGYKFNAKKSTEKDYLFIK